MFIDLCINVLIGMCVCSSPAFVMCGTVSVQTLD